MSKLELLIYQCKRVWAEMGVSQEDIDNLLDNFVMPYMSIDFNIEKITDDIIKTVTERHFSQYLNREPEEKNNEE